MSEAAAMYLVVEQTDHLPTRRHSCATVEQAVDTYRCIQDMWEWDDRFIGVHIEDGTGRRFRPTRVGDLVPTWELPLVEIPNAA